MNTSWWIWQAGGGERERSRKYEYENSKANKVKVTFTLTIFGTKMQTLNIQRHFQKQKLSSGKLKRFGFFNI